MGTRCKNGYTPDKLASRGDVPYTVSTDKIYWPFNGEFWDDELGSYQYAEVSVCR